MTWRSGTPPRDKPGWYQASATEDSECWRWWNGDVFSRACYHYQRVEGVWRDAQYLSLQQLYIKWKPQPRWYARWLRARGLPVGVTQ